MGSHVVVLLNDEDDNIEITQWPKKLMIGSTEYAVRIILHHGVCEEWNTSKHESPLMLTCDYFIVVYNKEMTKLYFDDLPDQNKIERGLFETSRGSQDVIIYHTRQDRVLNSMILTDLLAVTGNKIRHREPVLKIIKQNTAIAYNFTITKESDDMCIIDGSDEEIIRLMSSVDVLKTVGFSLLFWSIMIGYFIQSSWCMKRIFHLFIRRLLFQVKISDIFMTLVGFFSYIYMYKKLKHAYGGVERWSYFLGAFVWFAPFSVPMMLISVAWYYIDRFRVSMTKKYASTHRDQVMVEELLELKRKNERILRFIKITGADKYEHDVPREEEALVDSLLPAVPDLIQCED